MRWHLFQAGIHLSMSTESATAITASEKKRRGRAKKVDDLNVKACRVPSLRTEIKSTLWARYVHSIIEEFEPALLLREEVIDAYNAFVDCLAKHNDVFESWVPSKTYRYKVGIVYEKLTFDRYMDESIPGRFKNEDHVWRREELREEHKNIVREMKEAYKPLYDLIKRDVIPPLEKMVHEIRVKRWAPSYKRDIEDIQRYITKEEERHQAAMDHLHMILNNKINDLRQLMDGFKPTEFTD